MDTLNRKRAINPEIPCMADADSKRKRRANILPDIIPFRAKCRNGI
jgi:hypothetical protein